MAETLLWYDLETFGRNPRSSRICQFAAVRTDYDLNPVADPVSLFCRPADDFLPEPEAAMITGITPQHALEHGLCEAEFMAVVHEQLSVPGTCALGYNTLRFDDEFIRFSLYRCFHDAYEREYAGGNSRWDLLDIMRMLYALQPDSLQWPRREDGLPSFKLEHLAKANDCFEGEAHEALSDVRSLVNLARLAKNAAPDLWRYGLGLRDKNHVAAKLEAAAGHRILHISGQFSALNACTGLMLPLMPHPLIKTRTLAVELRPEALQLIDCPVEFIEHNLFTKAALLADGETRIGLKEIHHNRCPVVFTPDDAKALGLHPDFRHLNIDLGQARDIHAQLHAAAEPIRRKLATVFSKTRDFDNSDPDGALYGGFIDRADKLKFGKARASRGQAELVFNDARLTELYFRYKARNWPESLDAAERAQWQKHKAERLAPATVQSYLTQCDTLMLDNPQQASVLLALKDWVIGISDLG
jgi:exodeoxyribonuclease I